MAEPSIGVNALYLLPGEVGGTEVYLRALVAAMESIIGDRLIVFTNLETGVLGNRGVVLPVGARFRPERLLYEQTGFTAALRREKIGVLLNAGFTAPLLARCKQATVFHDLQHKRHPEYFKRWDLPAWQFMLWSAAHRSNHLIAVSDSTRQDLLHYYRLSASKISVVPHGVDDRFFQIAETRDRTPPSPAGSRYLLCPSTTHPHKNHARLLRVFSRLREHHPGLKLILTGARGFADANVMALLESLALRDAVDLKGWVPREELYALFQQASAFIYPSEFEGFGMPVLEALAAGVPSAVSNIEPLKTLAGAAAHLFDPQSEEEMFEALMRTLSSSPESIARIRQGREHAANFTWRRAAEQTLEVLESLLR